MAATPTYEDIVRKHRLEFVNMSVNREKRIRRLYAEVIRDLDALIASVPDGEPPSMRAIRAAHLKVQLEARMDALGTDLAGTIKNASVDGAGIMVEREALLASTFAGEDRAELIKAFANVPDEAFEAVAQRVLNDGLNLSDRLHKLDFRQKGVVNDIVLKGILTGDSAKEMAAKLKTVLTQEGADTAQHRALRIARTTINTAHREAHVRTVYDTDGKLKDWVKGIQWCLSASHKRAEMCDVYASVDVDGLGPGVYHPQNLPVSHPHCLCFTITVMHPITPPKASKGEAAAIDYEDQHWNDADHQYLAAIDPKTGDILAEVVDDHGAAYFGYADEAKAKDAIVTANFDKIRGPHSVDWEFFMRHDPAEIRFVGPSEDGLSPVRWMMKRPPGGWPDEKTWLDTYSDAEKSVTSAQDLFKSGGFKKLGGAIGEHNHLALDEATKKLGIDYSRHVGKMLPPTGDTYHPPTFPTFAPNLADVHPREIQRAADRGDTAAKGYLQYGTAPNPNPPAYPDVKRTAAPKKQKAPKSTPAPSAPPAHPSAVVDPFPDDLPERVTVVKRLGGSTGAELVEDPATGRRYVRKRGADEGHLREEATADLLYQSLGVDVPSFRLFERAGGPVKMAEFIPGETLDVVKASDPVRYAAALKTLQQDFFVDALMANYDVAGMSLDNILVGTDGRVWRIDNGASLRRRAQGALKPKDQFDGYVDAFWTMRDPKFNTPYQVFGKLDFFDILDSAKRVEGKGAALKAAIQSAPLPAADRAEIEAILTDRLANWKAYQTTAEEMRADEWKADYVDAFTRHRNGLRRAGIVNRFPKLLKQRAGDTLVRDENGKAFDDLRSGRAGIVGAFHDYLRAQNGNPTLLSDYMGAQAGDSWNDPARAVKYWWTQQRTASWDRYYWRNKFNATLPQPDAYDEARRLWEGVKSTAAETTLTAYHAFTTELLGAVDFRYNDRAARAVRILRTENRAVMTTYGLTRGQTGIKTLKRGALESGSIFKPTYVFGTEDTVQTLPHHRVFGTYFGERFPGHGGGAFLGDNENEFVFMSEGAEVDYVKATTDGGNPPK